MTTTTTSTTKSSTTSTTTSTTLTTSTTSSTTSTTTISSTTTTLSNWCFQESADQSSSCGGLASGTYICEGTWGTTYDCARAYDGDWSSFGKASAGTGYLVVNYSKPAGALNTSLWQIKDYSGAVNLTIPADCWSHSPDVVSFRFVSVYSATYSLTTYCFAGSWKSLRTVSGTSAYSRIYEEAMWWSLTSTTTTTTTSTSTAPTTTTTLAGCVMPGNYAPCDETSLSEVLDAINQWVAGGFSLSQVIDLINAWATQ